MSRSVRDLRELICMSRLSYHPEDDVENSEELNSSSSVPKETMMTTTKKLSQKKVLNPVSPPGTPGSSGRGSPLPPIGKSSSGKSSSSSDSPQPTSPTSSFSSKSGVVRPMPIVTRNYKTVKTNFDSLLSFFDATIVAEWLTRANKTVSELSSWVLSGDNFIKFANFWLTEVSPNKRSELVSLEYSIVMDELKFAFGVGLEGNQITLQDIVIFMNAVVWEYPHQFSPSQSSVHLLNILMCLCCGRKDNYRKLLSDVKCSTTNKQFVQFILATRAFAIVSIASGVITFYKQIHSMQDTTNVSGVLQGSDMCQVGKEFAFQAIQKGFVEVFRYFLYNYDVELDEDKGIDQKSFLFATILSEQEEMLKVLLKECSSKIDVNKRSSSSGNTPLHAAVSTGNVDIVRVLATTGADMNVWNGDCDGATPLHLAILSGNKEMVELLLSLGCDPTVKMGVPATVTPLVLAKDLGLDDIAAVLEAFKLE